MTEGSTRHDAAHWDERYAQADRAPFTEPDPAVELMLEGMPRGHGRALDLGCGEGRHAIWLARRGWSVTAVDFSHNGVETGRRLADEAGVGQVIAWVVADVAGWVPESEFDLILVSLFRLSDDDLARVRGWLAPGGHLLLVAHDDGPDGPRNPRFRSSLEGLRGRVAGMEVIRSEAVAVTGADGQRRGRVAVLAHRADDVTDAGP